MLRVEMMKLNRSLALLLCATAPTFVALLGFLMVVDRKTPGEWAQFTGGGAGMWATFMLPMTVTALTVLVAQIEHGPKGWNSVLAAPVARWRTFLAKALVVLGLVGAMSVLLWALVHVAGYAVEQVKGDAHLTGKPAPEEMAETLLRMYAASVFLVVLQLWAALRFRSFVPPLVLGIGGTFVAAIAYGSRYGVYFPWLLPVNAGLATEAWRNEIGLSLGLFGGIAALVAMLIHMSRYEAP
jgi:ABC-2 type transport system permease protein